MDLLYHFFIISAIISRKVSELNSKSYLLSGGTAIPKDADMNDYTEIGNYYCNQTTIAQTLENSPFTNAFILKIENAIGSSGYLRQTFIEYNTGRKAVRYRINSSSTWQEFVYFSDDATVLADTSGSAKESHINSAYTAIKEELWQTWKKGVINETFLYSGPLYGIIGYKNDDNYGSFIILSYFVRRPAYAYVNAGVWHDPVWI